jgi:hypothetical protein
VDRGCIELKSQRHLPAQRRLSEAPADLRLNSARMERQ